MPELEETSTAMYSGQDDTTQTTENRPQLRAPFAEDHSYFSSDSLDLPGTYHTSTHHAAISKNRGGTLTPRYTGLARVADDFQAFYSQELDVSRLNSIHEHLWLAGLERPARPLRQQIAIVRGIVVSERADVHLLWRDQMIYSIPLPEFLLCHDISTNTINRDKDLHERASGFLLSYLWLICHPSDLRIAKEHGLVPSSMGWHE
jgi:hypothetical protein